MTVNRKHLKYFLFISVCMIWGTTWLSMKIALESIPPLLSTGVRFLITSPLLIFLARKCNSPLLFPLGQRKRMLVVAVLYFAIPFWLMIKGEEFISAGLAAVIFSNMPVAVLIASVLMLGERFSLVQYVGLGISVVSISAILSLESDLSGQDYILGVCALSTAVFVHAYMYVYVRKYLGAVSVLTFNALPSGIASLLLISASFMFEGVSVSTVTLQSCVAVLYLGLVAGVGGIVAYFKLNEVATPFEASLCFLFFPLIALLIDSYIKNANLSPLSEILMIFLLIGIALTKMKSGKVVVVKGATARK